MISFIIPGEPQGKARPRFGKGRTYTPKETREYESLIKKCYLAEGNKINLTDRPVKIVIMACYEIPKSYSKAKRCAAVLGEIHPTKKPDCDNIIKVICDALNLVAYKDDKQIISCRCIKKYTEGKGYVAVCIEEVQ